MKRWPEITAIAALVATLATAVVAQDPTAPASPVSPPSAKPAAGNSFAIRNVRVFDGERVIDRANVVVRDGRIVAAGAGAIPAGLATIDGSGKTLLPGFIDAHTHSWGSAQGDALRFGVTSELDMLGDWNRLPALKQQRESLARTAQADLWSAGAAVTAPGGHGTQYGMKVPTLAADGDAQAFVAARAAEGSDYIKIIVEDFSTHAADRRLPTLTPPQVAAAIDAAHRNDRLAVVHVSRQQDAQHAIDAGANGLVHLFVDAPATPGFVRAADARDAFVVPTLSVLASVAGVGEGAKLAADPRLQPQLSGEQAGQLKARFPGASRNQLFGNALRSVAALHDAGVTILAGTDAGNPGTAHGASLHGELELLVRAGLSPAEALTAATAAPARRFGISDRGRIAIGQRADLLLVAGDPTRDITATRAIDTVWKNGYAIERNVAANAKPATAASVAPAGTLVSDFDGDTIDARIGTGWQPTTDQMMGGASTVRHALVAGGAAGSRGALEVRGEIKPGSPFPWSGMMFFPAAQPMQPVDFSKRRELVFWVRGDGRQYQAMLFSGPSAQGMPSMQAFTAGAQWQEVRLPLAGFAGADPALLRGVAFTAGQPRGAFVFRIDRVELR
ncbi:CIA30 family protein [Lysobacter koreensis]|uniref:CIA30 family protein n=1 Tax=Lysobacter koreensis TaxID=266122 RepID=A0ABW2YL92_9GAMM